MFLFVGFGFKLSEDWFREYLSFCICDMQKVIIPSKESCINLKKSLWLLQGMPLNYLHK